MGKHRRSKHKGATTEGAADDGDDVAPAVAATSGTAAAAAAPAAAAHADADAGGGEGKSSKKHRHRHRHRSEATKAANDDAAGDAGAAATAPAAAAVQPAAAAAGERANPLATSGEPKHAPDADTTVSEEESDLNEDEKAEIRVDAMHKKKTPVRVCWRAMWRAAYRGDAAAPPHLCMCTPLTPSPHCHCPSRRCRVPLRPSSIRRKVRTRCADYSVRFVRV